MRQTRMETSDEDMDFDNLMDLFNMSYPENGNSFDAALAFPKVSFGSNSNIFVIKVGLCCFT